MSAVAKVVRSGYLEAAANLLRNVTVGILKEPYCSLRVYRVSTPIKTPAMQFEKLLIGTQYAANSKSLCVSLKLPMYA